MANPYGGGLGSVPGGGLTPARGGGNLGQGGSNTTTITKDISRVSGSDSVEILSISKTDLSTAHKSPDPKQVILENRGRTGITAICKYPTYSDGDSQGVTATYMHYFLLPGARFNVPLNAVASSTNQLHALDASKFIDFEAPNSNAYTDSTAKTTEGFADDNDTTITFDDASAGVAHLMFKVNDLIRLDDEVCRITSIVDTAGDGAYTPAHFIVDRAVHGTAKADHTNNTAIRLPFFNAYHDFDKYTVAQTDSNGKFKCFNFFGLGRAVSGVSGLVPGSVAIKFYDAGYQSLGLSGISGITNSGLTVSTEYGFDITVDGSGLLDSDTMKFTTDSSNVKWGGTSGVLSKIQDVFDTQYYTTGSAINGERVTVGIVDGDIRFMSGQRLSSSAILLAAPSAGETTPFGVGAIPAIGSVNAPVAARLPDDVIYDRTTYLQTPNSSVFGYDDGRGRLFGACVGTICYERGMLDFVGPANAEFVYSVAHTSAFSGKLNEGTDGRINCLVDVLANTPSQKWDGKVQVRQYK